MTLSVLLPIHNYVCLPLVSELQRQAALLGIDYEIIVGDDGSSDQQAIEANRKINTLSHCRLLEHKPNIGRAAIRNLLANEASHEWLLFLDGDMQVDGDGFLSRYAAQMTADNDVVDGGMRTASQPMLSHSNLRYMYERAEEPRHTAAARQQQPYRSFRTTNFMVRRTVMLTYPFDERFRHYGYEDVLFGKQLAAAGVKVAHIDNPLVLTDIEENIAFLKKTEEAMRTLNTFCNELHDYSRLLDFTQRMPRIARSLMRLWHRMAGNTERRWLAGSHPDMAVFKLYKLGYLLSLRQSS